VVKGCNKRIIEVLNTENEYFEKAILFINPQSNLSYSQALRTAEQYMKEIDPDKKKRKKKKGSLALGITFFGVLICGIILGVLLSFPTILQ